MQPAPPHAHAPLVVCPGATRHIYDTHTTLALAPAPNPWSLPALSVAVLGVVGACYLLTLPSSSSSLWTLTTPRVAQSLPHASESRSRLHTSLNRDIGSLLSPTARKSPGIPRPRPTLPTGARDAGVPNSSRRTALLYAMGLLTGLAAWTRQRKGGIKLPKEWTIAAVAEAPQTVADLKVRLYEELGAVAPNGLSAGPAEQRRIADLVAQIEALNPTPKPSRSPLMAGFWRMLYTDMEPAPSSGKLGPFVGDVFQDLQPEKDRIVNLLKVGRTLAPPMAFPQRGHGAKGRAVCSFFVPVHFAIEALLAVD